MERASSPTRAAVVTPVGTPDAPSPLMPCSTGTAATAMEELRVIERQLKNWFLTRRVLMEHNIRLRELFKNAGVQGISSDGLPGIQPPRPKGWVPTRGEEEAQHFRDLRIWKDLVHERPELEDVLSPGAREMKVELYDRMFRNSTDLQHPCRASGVQYIRCLRNNLPLSTAERKDICQVPFNSFSDCRNTVVGGQRAALAEAAAKQESQDRMASAWWSRRAELLSMLRNSDEGLNV